MRCGKPPIRWVFTSLNQELTLSTNRWLSARLQYLSCVIKGNTAVLYFEPSTKFSWYCIAYLSFIPIWGVSKYIYIYISTNNCVRVKRIKHQRDPNRHVWIKCMVNSVWNCQSMLILSPSYLVETMLTRHSLDKKSQLKEIITITFYLLKPYNYRISDDHSTINWPWIKWSGLVLNIIIPSNGDTWQRTVNVSKLIHIRITIFTILTSKLSKIILFIDKNNYGLQLIMLYSSRCLSKGTKS